MRPKVKPTRDYRIFMTAKILNCQVPARAGTFNLKEGQNGKV